MRKRMAFILAVIIAISLIGCADTADYENSAGTLMGDTEIYPTVMVNGRLYEWRKYMALCNGLPNDSIYYGEIAHVEGETPENDCEFVSVFSVSGQIYTIVENDEFVCLCLTTDWLNEAVVIFDLVENDTSE